MKINELFNDINFKETFNLVYKNYYKSQNLPNHKIIELSLFFKDLFDDCKKNHSNIESVIDKRELASHLLYSLSKIHNSHLKNN